MPTPGTLTRRTLMAGAAGAAGAALFWPSSRRHARAPRARVELRYWEKWTGIEGIALQRIVDRYNQSQERAWVRLVPVSDIGSKAMVAIGGGDPPDVVGLYSYHVPGYAEARAVLPLDGFAQIGAIDEAAYLPGVRAALRHEGRLWAGVNTCYSLAMYANREHLREVGHNPDTPVRSVTELDELAMRLTHGQAGGGVGGRIERAGFLQNVPGWWNYFWPCMFGGSLFDEANQRITIASQENIACFKWLRGSAQRFGVSATTTFASGYGRNIHSAQDPFISGHQSMIVQGPWLANFIRSMRPGLEYTAFPVPTVSGDSGDPTGLLEADVLMIPRGCPHPEEAYRFVQFMQRQDVQEELALAHAKPSPLMNVSAGFEREHPNKAIRVFEAVARSPRVMILPRTASWKQYADLINAAFDRVWAGADPAKELGIVQTRGQQMIDTAAARRAVRDRRTAVTSPERSEGLSRGSAA